MVEIDSLDYTGSKPEVWFRFRGIDMSADLDPGVIAPVVVKGTAVGCEVDVTFNDYEKLQMTINEFVKNEKSGSSSGELQEYPSIDRIGVDISVGRRKIVRERVIYESRITCEWTDGSHVCCETFVINKSGGFYSGVAGYSVREVLEMAAKEGWIVVCGRPVCGCHIDDPDDEEITDLADMVKHFSEQKN